VHLLEVGMNHILRQDEDPAISVRWGFQSKDVGSLGTVMVEAVEAYMYNVMDHFANNGKRPSNIKTLVARRFVCQQLPALFTNSK
jgi:hypothetical protein